MTLWLDRPNRSLEERLAAMLVGRRIQHLNGTAWYERRKPMPWHRCRTVSRYEQRLLVVLRLERCACGAIRHIHNDDPGPWRHRNSRWLRRAKYGSLA